MYKCVKRSLSLLEHHITKRREKKILGDETLPQTLQDHNGYIIKNNNNNKRKPNKYIKKLKLTDRDRGRVGPLTDKIPPTI